MKGKQEGGKTESREKRTGDAKRRPFDFPSFRLYLGCETRECLADFAFTEPLQGPVAQLTDTFPCHAKHPADFFERVLATTIEPKVQILADCGVSEIEIKRLGTAP